MSWSWFALCDEAPAECLAAARVLEPRGDPAGWLVAWPTSDEAPAQGALRIDARAIEPAGPEAQISLVLAPPGVRIPFDDPAVLGARRAVMSAHPPRLLSTLLIDPSTFGGALTIPTDANVDDPFGRLFAARRLQVEGGLLASELPAPVGPSIERYGSGNPWPWDRFEDD